MSFPNRNTSELQQFPQEDESLLEKQFLVNGNPVNAFVPQASSSSELTMDDIIVRSELCDPDPNVQTENVLQAFNKNRETIMEQSVAFGTRIKRDEFRLVHRNNRPELVGFTRTPLRKKIYFTGTTEDICISKQTDLLIGAHGSYVLNVSKGYMVTAFYGLSIPIIYGEGVHVIHNNTFKLPKNSLCPLNTQYVKHGTYHILRVPKGKLAKIWLGNEPYLLESRSEPYIFNSPLFKLEPKSNDEILEDAFSEVIIHGSIKRLVPKTGKVAITYNNGNLMTFSSSEDGRPILITDENHIFDGFLTTNTQTIVFPCERTKEERRKERPNDHDYIEYESLRTRDGLPIGIKLLVVFSIEDPAKTLSMLNKDQIEPHIENIVVADMSMVIQRCNSTDFQNTDMTRTMPHMRDTMINTTVANNENAPPSYNVDFIRYLQDSVKNKLTADFKEYGIDLVRVNIETPKILDKAIAAKMSEFSLLTASANSRESTIEQTFNIAKKEAEQLATQNEIKQDQENQNKINSARAELEAAKLKAEAKTVTAEAEATAARAVEEARAKLFVTYPKLFEYEMAKLQSAATRSIKTTVVSPEIAKGMLTFGNSYPFGNDFLGTPKSLGKHEEGDE